MTETDAARCDFEQDSIGFEDILLDTFCTIQSSDVADYMHDSLSSWNAVRISGRDIIITALSFEFDGNGADACVE